VESRWVQVTPSEFPWERDALAFLKGRLPDHEPYHVWANFEFLLDGTIGEVDALVIAPKGVFLVEIKSWPGLLEGDAGTWRNTRPGAMHARAVDNPLLLANRKAKRLKSLLTRQRAFRGERVPFVRPLIFLSSAELNCRLSPEARSGVHGLDVDDPHEAPTQRGGLSGIVHALASLNAEERERLGDRRIDKPMAKRIAAALEQAGVRPAQRRRQVGDLELGELIDEGPGYQDFEASNPRFTHTHRRVRIYGTPDMASVEQRAQASRAAQREFELLAPVEYPGIVRAIAFHELELGPAIVFERDPSEIRLDRYLEEMGSTLSLFDRVALVRQMAETVAFAHGRRVFHRALSPDSVLVVKPGQSDQRFRIINWQTGARASGATVASTVEGTRHVEQLVNEQAAAYLAPETLTRVDADAELQDVFSLGALAFLVFTDRAPAATQSALLEVLQRDGSLEVVSVLDGAGRNLAALVRGSTSADTSRRISSLAEFLVYLEAVEEEVSAPPIVDAADELILEEVKKGHLLGNFEVERRLGRGSTAIAFLVRDTDQQERVLKIAVDPERNRRIMDEAEVLAKLRDKTIIAAHGEPIEVGGHAGIVLAFASEGTLAKWLRKEGPLGLETLERWGENLLSAVSYLEQVGIPHRDIKPENLGIIELGPRKLRQLVLMDFSLARAAPEQVHAGTPPYLDPFLGTTGRDRWDLAADRFAAAMVLHEMAAGTLPRWGDGRGDPQFAEGEAHVDSDAFPREVAGALGDFFGRALRRSASERFDTAEDMLRAWRRIFQGLVQPVAGDAEDAQEAARERGEATFDTPLAVVGLSARATNALERVSAFTVGDLLAIPPFDFNRLRGVGLATRSELVRVHRELRARLGTPKSPFELPTQTTTVDEPDVQPLDVLVTQLTPRKTSRNASSVDAVRLLVGLEVTSTLTKGWLSQSEVSQVVGISRGRVGQILTRVRGRWRSLPAVTRLRDELVDQVERLGGVATSVELERLVAAERGSGDPDSDAMFSRAAVRAAVETEVATEQPRLAVRRTRSDGRVLIAGAGQSTSERQRAADYAVRLGAVADELADSGTLPAPAEVAERLRAVRAPELVQLSQERLVQLAAAASEHAVVSARLEIYPRGMSAARALRLSRGALLGIESISVEEVARRVAARFPEAEALPPRPALDGLLAGADVDVSFDDLAGRYVANKNPALTGETSYASPLARLVTAHSPILALPRDRDATEAERFEERLTSSIRAGGLLILMADQRYLAEAARELRRFEVTPIDLDDLLISRLHAAAEAANVRWDLVLRADSSDPSSADWSRLTALVDRAMPSIEKSIIDTPGTVLLERAGLLARYGKLGLLERLREAASGGQTLKGVWLLLPADGQAERPVLDKSVIPVVTRNEWLRIPLPWLRNLHRAEHQEIA
jgi:serine/threonine protein kinase